jgi:hypothetical protein
VKKRINKKIRTSNNSGGQQQQYQLEKIKGIFKKNTSTQITITASSLLYISLIAG